MIQKRKKKERERKLQVRNMNNEVKQWFKMLSKQKGAYSPSLINPPQTIVALTRTENPKRMKKSGITRATAPLHFWWKRDDSD